MKGAMTPVERLKAFIADMLQWEAALDEKRREQRSRRDTTLHTQTSLEAREMLRRIFIEHLSTQAFATKAQSRLDLLTTGRPPEFAQRVLEDTASAKGKTIYIETVKERGHLAARRRYALVIEGNEPKVDTTYCWRDSTGAWEEQEAI